MKVRTFFHSPGKTANDPNQLSVSVMWPVKDIKANEAFFRDYLAGYTEKQFRSARLYSWFDLPTSYFEQ